MNWYKTSQVRVLWHATIPRHAEEVLEAGIIKPSGELDTHYRGWSFQEKGFDYSQAVYLSANRETAISYGLMRLRNEWKNTQEEDIEPLLTDEDLQYIALFKINVSKPSLKLKLNTWGRDLDEYVYLGGITNDSSQPIWFEGPEWIDKTAEAKAEYNRLEKIYSELYGELVNANNPVSNIQTISTT